MNTRAFLLVYLIGLLPSWSENALADWKISSPDGKVALTVQLGTPSPGGKARLSYKVEYDGKELLAWSPLGIVRKDQAFVDGLALESAAPVATSDSTYTMPHGKRRVCRDHFAEQVLSFKGAAGGRMELVLRAYDDGVALRYRFPETNSAAHTVVEEVTGFRLPSASKCWMHPYDKATEYSPAYETYYEDGIASGTPSPNKEGWAFPVLFQAGGSGPWGLLTEAGLDRSYCGARLSQNASDGLYSIRFPDAAEGNGTGAVEPSWTLPWATPWRVVMAGGSASRIVESTLVTNLAAPCAIKDTSWIKPGRASWSWLYDHDSPQDFTKLCRFIDLAAEMGWEYSLVDANWTHMRGGSLPDLAEYAKKKGAGLLVWYNSGGAHNYVSEKPRGLMDPKSVRRKELRWLSDAGVKGVKVDFFQSDKQNIIQLYHDILEDAAEARIMVNFHGCTLPRGWSRTYPHLMSMEAVRGAECYSFDRNFTARAPIHNVTVPFTRNAVGPMDYTPVVIKNNVYPHITTTAHELALPVIFESGWLHFGDGPEPYMALPLFAKAYLKRIPASWDETRCLDGEPGKFILLARRSGETWFVAGINGREKPRDICIDFAFLAPGDYSTTFIEDGEKLQSKTGRIQAGARRDVALEPRGGFILEIRPAR